MFRRIFGLFLILLIVAGTLYQGAIAGKSITDFWRTKVWANRRLDAVARSADVAFGQNFSEYIKFLGAAIPQDAVVVIPGQKEGKFDLNSVGLMQYFLFSRRIRSCNVDCASLMANPGTYILAQGEFPPKEQVPPTKQYLPFSDDLGLYSPKEGGN